MVKCKRRKFYNFCQSNSTLILSLVRIKIYSFGLRDCKEGKSYHCTIIDIPCLVPESRDHDVLVLMSQDRLSWKQIRANFDNEMSSCTSSRRVTLDYLPAYIGLYTRHRMTSLNVDGGGGK